VERLRGERIHQLNFVSIDKVVAVTLEFVMSHLLNVHDQVGRKSSVAFVSSRREDDAGLSSKPRLDLNDFCFLLFILTDFAIVRNSRAFVLQFFSRTVVHFKQSAL